MYKELLLALVVFIYDDTYEQTKDENLAYLYVDISKNGFLIKLKELSRWT